MKYEEPRVGEMYGKWKVLGMYFTINEGKELHIYCECTECGTNHYVNRANLVSGRSNKCRRCSTKHLGSIGVLARKRMAKERWSDEIGNKYGCWTIIDAPVSNPEGKRGFALSECECGERKYKFLCNARTEGTRCRHSKGKKWH